MTRSPRRGWAIAIATGIVAVAALVAGSAFGTVNAATVDALDKKLVAWISAGVLLVFGVVSTSRIAASLSHRVASSSVPSAGGTVRILSAAVGYLFVIFAVLAVLRVSVEHLLVAAGLAGVVLGIAAQQSLGNVFAGLVLVMARPFTVGDHVRVRSGALGGVFDAWVHEMSLTYVTLRTDDGDLKIPNSAMLAAGVGRLPKRGATPLTTQPSVTPPPPTEAPRPVSGDGAPADEPSAREDPSPTWEPRGRRRRAAGGDARRKT